MYRENAAAPRPAPTVEVTRPPRGGGGFLALLFFGLVVALGVGIGTCGGGARSIRVACSRSAEGAEPECAVETRGDGPPATRRFHGRAGALWSRSCEHDRATCVELGRTQLVALHADRHRADRLLEAYEAFVATPSHTRFRFEIREPSSNTDL